MLRRVFLLGIVFGTLIGLVGCKSDLQKEIEALFVQVYELATDIGDPTLKELDDLLIKVDNLEKQVKESRQVKAITAAQLFYIKLDLEIMREKEYSRLNADFVINIYVENTVLSGGEYFVVNTILLNQSDEEIAIHYYYAPVMPHIEGWNYPFPVIFPIMEELIIESNSYYKSSWLIGGTKDFEENKDKRWVLSKGKHELKFHTWITINEQKIEICSNAVKLTVT